MLQDEILIKFLPIDGFAAFAIIVYKVTTLADKSWNNYMKAEPL